MIRQRAPKQFQVRVYAGMDPATGARRFKYQTVHGTKTDARRAEHALARELELAGPIPADMTVAELLDQWLTVARLEPSTLYQHRRTIARHVSPQIGTLRLAQLDVLTLDRLYLDLTDHGGHDGGPLSGATVNGVHRILHAALGQAVRWGLLAYNPAGRARTPSVEHRGPHAPDPATVAALLAGATKLAPDLAVFLRVSASTGLRRGAVLALRWSDIDTARAILRTTRAIKTGGKGHGAYEGTTKTGAVHPVALDPTTIAILEEHHGRMQALAESLDTTIAGDGYVFSDEPDASIPISPEVLSRRFGRLRDRLELPSHVTLRELRHWVATTLLDAGVPVGTVSARLSHARTSTTTDVYAAWVPETDRAAAGIIEQVLAQR